MFKRSSIFPLIPSKEYSHRSRIKGYNSNQGVGRHFTNAEIGEIENQVERLTRQLERSDATMELLQLRLDSVTNTVNRMKQTLDEMFHYEPDAKGAQKTAEHFAGAVEDPASLLQAQCKTDISSTPPTMD